METKKYASYAEIDQELAILKLEREIHLEKMKLCLDKTKENLKLGNVLEGYLEFSEDSKPNTLSRMFFNLIPIFFNWLNKKKDA